MNLPVGRSQIKMSSITKHKQIEETEVIQEKREDYRRVFENQMLAISIFDTETLQIININNTHIQLYGYSREELLSGMKSIDLSAEPETSIQSIQSERSKTTFFIPLRYHKKKDGTTFPVEIAGETYLRDGRLVMLGMVRDISQRMQMEDALLKSKERLALALKAIPDAIWDWDLLTDQIYYSPRWWAMIGYEANELAADSSLWQRLIHPDDLERSTHVVNEAIAGQENFYEIESRRLHKQGHYVPILTRGFIQRDKNGNAVRISGLNTDLTERKKTEEAKQKIAEQLQQLDKAESLNRMAGAIAHNFNNLLGAVLGFIELAMEELPPDGTPSKHLAKAFKATERAVEVSRMMLTYLGQSCSGYTHLDLSEVCSSSLPKLKEFVKEKIAFATEFQLPGPAIIANANQIQLLLKNLVVNASEALQGENGRITLAIRTVSSADIPTSHRFPIDWQPQEELFACLEVKDTGSGISAKDFGKIFDPFFTTKFAGRGLGLAIVLGILRSLRGVVTVKNELDRGSVFQVYLPLSPENVPHACPDQGFGPHHYPALSEGFDQVKGGG